MIKAFSYYLIVILIPFVQAYYVGESIFTTLIERTGKSEASKAQSPKFAEDSSAFVPRTKDRFSLAFEEGYHQLPWFDTLNLGKVRVTFVYSKSGDGVIHSVSSEPVMKNLHDEYSRQQLEVEYVWVEEHPVDPQAGSIVMFLATLVLSVLLVLKSCGISDMDEETTGSSSNDILGAENHLYLHKE